MSFRRVTALDVETALSRPGTSVLLREALDRWPVCLLVPRIRYDNTDCQELRGRSIIVIGLSLGNNVVELPHHIGTEVVVVALMNSTSEPRYGYATQPYKWGHARTWECDVDFTPPKVALHFVNSLILHWGATGGVSLIGASAGAPKIWCFFVTLPGFSLSLFNRLLSFRLTVSYGCCVMLSLFQGISDYGGSCIDA